MSSWTSAVNDFLTKKPSPPGGKKNRKLITYKSSSVSSPDAVQKKAGKKYKPKAQVEPPSVEDQYNKMLKSCSSGDKAHIGTIKNWHGKFGFLKCDAIEDKIFLHSKDIKEGRDLVDEGRRAVFQVLHYKKSVVGAKAVNVVVLKD
jgi:cold shock CspA family protein